MTARAKRVKYALTVFRKYHKNGAYCTFNKATAKFDFTVVQFFQRFGFYNWAFGVPGNFSTSSNEKPQTGERLHSGKTQVQNISQSPSTSWNLGGVANIYMDGSKGGRDGSRVKDGTSSTQHMAAI